MGGFYAAVQAALEAAGHPPGRIDGVIGRQSRAAIRAWQAARGYSATGALSVAQKAELLGWSDTVEGIDVSGWQDRVDWARVAGAGVRWAAIKVTQDERPGNADVSHQSAGARECMEVVIPYHFPEPDRTQARDAEREAAAFLRQHERFGPWSGPPAYDLEAGENRSAPPAAALADDEYNLRHVVTWLDQVETALGIAPNSAIVYFGMWSLDLFINRAARAGTSAELVVRLTARPGWQADYHTPNVTLTPIDRPWPWSWEGVMIHQYAGRRDDPVARCPGVRGACDRNRMRRAFFERLTEVRL